MLYGGQGGVKRLFRKRSTPRREDGAALIKRLEGEALTADDQRVLVQVLQQYMGTGTVGASCSRPW